jgi:CHASE1-domain containing sensor protein
MNIVNDIITTIANLKKATTALNKANTAVLNLTVSKVDAENTLEIATAKLFTEGKVEGSNEATRKASIASQLSREMDAVKQIEFSLITAKAKATEAENNFRMTNQILNALQTVAKVQSGVSEG